MQRELPPSPYSRELPSSQLKRSVFLSWRDLKAKVEADGSTSWVNSLDARKLLFGRESSEVFKIQSGVRIAVKPQELLLRASPTSASFAPRWQDKVQVFQQVRLAVGECGGSIRTVRLTNRGDAAVRLRVLTLHDPTALNFRRDRDPPGEIGVNAFNRHDQVVMDEVGDTAGVRVIGFNPRPSAIYMTKDKGRASELMALGELPESSLGMSGSIMVLTQQDFDLPPGGVVEVRSVSVYHPSSLESALNASDPSGKFEEADHRVSGPDFASSSASLNFAFEWAKASLFAIEGEPSLAERLWSGVALALLRPDYFQRLADSAKASARKDGTLRYSESGASDRTERAGPLETCLYLVAACAFLSARSGDRKLIKKWYPHLKKLGDGLAGMASKGLVAASVESPDGWRRRLGAGFPTGASSEVNLLALRALREASTLASLAGNAQDSARFQEAGARLVSSLNEKLRDPESGVLALNVDSRGVVHKETTIDQAVGLSFFSPDQSLASSVVHRLLEKDFETGYGPRTIPVSNSLYFNASYGEGQLGGYWTRSALSHAILAFASGYPGIGSSQLEKVARLVHLDADRLGGVPGEFPYWMDTDRRHVMGPGTDPVAAAKFVEALVFGEGGLSLGPPGPEFKVPDASQLRWLFFHAIDLGKKCSIFIARSGARTFVVSTLAARAAKGLSITNAPLQECERVGGQPGLEGLVFWDNSTSLICLGNTTPVGYSGALSVPLKSKAFTTSLFAQVEELQPETGLWVPTGRVKPLSRLETRVDLKPGSWKILRLSRVAQ